jgi:hypothetical protein
MKVCRSMKKTFSFDCCWSGGGGHWRCEREKTFPLRLPPAPAKTTQKQKTKRPLFFLGRRRRLLHRVPLDHVADAQLHAQPVVRRAVLGVQVLHERPPGRQSALEPALAAFFFVFFGVGVFCSSRGGGVLVLGRGSSKGAGGRPEGQDEGRGRARGVTRERKKSSESATESEGAARNQKAGSAERKNANEKNANEKNANEKNANEKKNSPAVVLAVGDQVARHLLHARAEAGDLGLGRSRVLRGALEAGHAGEVDVLLVAVRGAVVCFLVFVFFAVFGRERRGGRERGGESGVRRRPRVRRRRRLGALRFCSAHLTTSVRRAGRGAAGTGAQQAPVLRLDRGGRGRRRERGGRRE